MALKQVILVRQDLKLPKGKLAVQVAHASVEAVLRSEKALVAKWRSEGMKKIVLEAKDLEELLQFQQEAKSLKLVNSLITDAGLTSVAPGTTTCLAIGRDFEERIDRITGKLKIL